MNHFLPSADGATHVKIVVVALVCAIMIVVAGIAAHLTVDGGVAMHANSPVLKAAKPVSYTNNKDIGVAR